MNFKLGNKKKKITGLTKPKSLNKSSGISTQVSVFGQGDFSDDESETEALNNEQSDETEFQRLERLKQAELKQRRETAKAIQQQSQKLQKAAVEQLNDAIVYQYDELYDNMKENEQRKKSKKKGINDSLDGMKSQHMEGILKNKAERELRRVVADDLKIKKTIKDEEEKYGKVESFVTGAYKQKQKEMTEVVEKEKKEQEEREREAKKRRNRQGKKFAGSGLTGMYQRILNESDDDGEEEHHEKEVVDIIEGTDQLHAGTVTLSNSKAASNVVKRPQKEQPGFVKLNLYEDSDDSDSDDKEDSENLGAGLNVASDDNRPLMKQDRNESYNDDKQHQSNDETTSFINFAIGNRNNSTASANKKQPSVGRDRLIDEFLKSKITEDEKAAAKRRYFERVRQKNKIENAAPIVTV